MKAAKCTSLKRALGRIKEDRERNAGCSGALKSMFPRYQYENETTLDALKRKFHEDAYVYRIKALQEETPRSRSCSPPKCTAQHQRPQSAPFVGPDRKVKRPAHPKPFKASKSIERSPYASSLSPPADVIGNDRPRRPHSSAGMVRSSGNEWGSSKGKGGVRKKSGGKRPSSRMSEPDPWHTYEELCDQKISESIDAIERSKRYGDLAQSLRSKGDNENKKEGSEAILFGGKEELPKGKKVDKNLIKLMFWRRVVIAI